MNSSPSGAGLHRRLFPWLFVLGTILVSGIGLLFFSEGEISWAETNRWLLIGTVVVAVLTFIHASALWSVWHAFALLGIAIVVTVIAEWAGVHFGIPFGSQYSYHDELQPRLFGVLPLFVPLAWFSLLYSPLAILDSIPMREKGPPRLWVRVPVAAVLVAAADLYLDPLAVDADAWEWEREGKWYGIPLSNFAGWWIVGASVYAIHLPLAEKYFSRRTGEGQRRNLHLIVWMGVVVLGAAALVCLWIRIEHGWIAIAAGILAFVKTAVIWHRWGNAPAEGQ